MGKIEDTLLAIKKKEEKEVDDLVLTSTAFLTGYSYKEKGKTILDKAREVNFDEELLFEGVYIFLLDGEPVYVGESKCLLKRISEHLYGNTSLLGKFYNRYPHRSREDLTVKIISTHTLRLRHNRNFRRKIENLLIKKFHPPLNRK